MLRFPPLYILLALGLLGTVLYLHAGVSSRVHGIGTASFAPANTTLGFGALMVVSGPGSPRREGLVESANVTNLDLTIPELPSWSEERIAEFREQDSDSTITDGSIRAWLSHNVVLEAFLKSGLETALILEDDVDWDIRLRSVQAPLAAAAARSILPSAGEDYYWGHPDDWDLMYVGHCGDYFTTLDENVGVGVVHPEDLALLSHVLFRDDTLPERTNLHPFTASLLTALGVPEKTRILHRSQQPLCTFGYAVTRASAKRLVEELAPISGQQGSVVHAYDVAILNACRDEGLRCYTVNPELFHHMEGQSLIDGLDRKVYRPPVDKAGSKQVYWRGETSNIGCGFWSRDFSWGGDKSRLAYLKKEVGCKGRCLKAGRTEDGGLVKHINLRTF